MSSCVVCCTLLIHSICNECLKGYCLVPLLGWSLHLSQKQPQETKYCDSHDPGVILILMVDSVHL